MKICHKQTPQPGAHVNGLLCCVPVAGWKGYFAYHCFSYTENSLAAAEHCNALQNSEFLSYFSSSSFHFFLFFLPQILPLGPFAV